MFTQHCQPSALASPGHPGEHVPVRWTICYTLSLTTSFPTLSFCILGHIPGTLLSFSVYRWESAQNLGHGRKQKLFFSRDSGKLMSGQMADEAQSGFQLCSWESPASGCSSPDLWFLSSSNGCTNYSTWKHREVLFPRRIPEWGNGAVATLKNITCFALIISVNDY